MRIPAYGHSRVSQRAKPISFSRFRFEVENCGQWSEDILSFFNLSSGISILFRCIVLKPGRQHVSTHGYTVMEQLVARDLIQSLAAGIMLVEPQQSSDNSLCSHPAASNTSQAGIIGHKLQKRPILAPNSKPKFDPKNEAIFGFA